LAGRRRSPAPGAAGRGRRCRVSVVTPTTSERAGFHAQLWDCFRSQTWLDKELIVVETYRGEPSGFFPDKARCYNELVHVRFNQEFSVGLKRNIGLHLASGDVIVNFDDDDLYAPEYVETMVGHLQERDLVALTLSAWYDFDRRHGKCGFVDPIALTDLHLLPWGDPIMQGADPAMPELQELLQELQKDTVYGYGFSFVHLREPALRHPYPNYSMGEDLVFMLGLREAFGHDRVGLLRDDQGLCVHVMHGDNTADSAAHRAVSSDEARQLAVLQALAPDAALAQAVERGPGALGPEIGKFRAEELPSVCERNRWKQRARHIMAQLEQLAQQKRSAVRWHGGREDKFALTSGIFARSAPGRRRP